MIVDQLALMAFALPAAVVTVWWMQTAANRLQGWLGSAATTVLLMLLARTVVATMDHASILLTACAVPGAGILLERADVWWRYLSEPTA
jgi:hypothetical protein